MRLDLNLKQLVHFIRHVDNQELCEEYLQMSMFDTAKLLALQLEISIKQHENCGVSIRDQGYDSERSY